MSEIQEQLYPAVPKLPNINEVEPLQAEDMECLREIRDVLAKHGRLNRFGVNLLHGHFDVATDECLVEVCDPEKRTLMILPVNRSELAGQRMMETNWRLDSGESLLDCWASCIIDYKGDHMKAHWNGMPEWPLST